MLEEVINQTILFIGTFTATLFASVSGGGAGFIQFPLLILLGLPFGTALGTHKVAVVFLAVYLLYNRRMDTKTLLIAIGLYIFAIVFSSEILSVANDIFDMSYGIPVEICQVQNEAGVSVTACVPFIN